MANRKRPKHLLARFLGWFFRLLYGPFSWAYDFVACIVSLGRWKVWVHSVIPYLHSSFILELGHGPGHLQVALNQAGKFSIGLDPSRHMGSQARRRLRRFGLATRLVRARSQQLPFASNSLPQIVSTFPSDYIADGQTLAEIYRVLVHGGSAIILLYAWITGTNCLEKLAAWLFRSTGESPEWDDHYLDPARAVGFSASSEYILLPKSKLLRIHLLKP